MRPALRPRLPRIHLSGHVMLYLTAFLTIAALIYLGYAMIRPERF
jgi:hypothetical protein